MKFRIDKIPKSEEDLNEIQREVEEEEQHHHHHHEHSEEELLTELYMSLQGIEGRVTELEKSNDECKKEISRLYKIISKLLLATLTENKDERIKNLKDIIGLLE
ncbi:hypothetical protein EWF20_09460 [Sulfolobus sp. S-194]|uniref:hypothetical protein n=1 Tax=Sulfolobus sp. S-194 TaxID=2512240 RepID=UPI00143732E9|nr:hypothetical protein [Sulfolobus sp. S-194]QIW24354.1 hypothetical protein EWF20_09460 [Sulfolobus sp. S-194]